MRLRILSCIAMFLLFINARNPILAQQSGKLTYSLVAQMRLPPVPSLAWSPDGARLAIVSYPSISVWETKPQELQPLVTDAQVSTVAWSPDSSKIASVQGGEDESLLIWDSSTGSLINKITYPQPYKAYAYNLSWSPDGKRIASDSTALDVLIWNPTGKEVYALKGFETGRVGETAWSPDSSHVAAAGGDGTIRIWDLATAVNVLTIQGGGPIDWHPTDNKLAGSGGNGDVAYIWDAGTGRELMKFEHGASLDSIKWNFDGSMVATGGIDGIVKIWNAQSGILLALVKEHSQMIISLAWCPSTDILASASYDGDIRIWKFDK